MPGRKYTSAATDNEYGYSGDFSRKNAQFNWNEFQYRNYDTRIGRWLSPDPARQYSSPYVGMGNNPVSIYDPTGLWGYQNERTGEYKWFDNVTDATEFYTDGWDTWVLVSKSLERFSAAMEQQGIGEDEWREKEYDAEAHGEINFGQYDKEHNALVDLVDGIWMSGTDIDPNAYEAQKWLERRNSLDMQIFDTDMYPNTLPASGRLESSNIIFDILTLGGFKFVSSAAKKGIEITERSIAKALIGSEMKTLQGEVSLPMIERYVEMLRKGSVAPPIKVADNVIIEGNHRYVSGRLFGTEPAKVPYVLPRSMSSQVKSVQSLKVTKKDWGGH